MDIALIVPGGISGGVATVFQNLCRGLLIEGFNVNVISLDGKNSSFFSNICDDILKCRRLMEQDLALYIGSIPYPSHVFAKSVGVPVALFIHGYVYHELFKRMLRGTGLKTRISAAIQAIMLNIANYLNTIDLYVCPSLTVCEINKISRRYVLLPQWLFPEEFEIPKASSDEIENSVVRIVTYTSYEVPPRLLNTTHLIALTRKLERMVKRKFELIIIDPRAPRECISSTSPNIKVIRYLPRPEFLSLLASADLYIERGIDEDLGRTILEAMALGTPVAKLTHPIYWDRQDFNEEDMILASSFRELAEKIAEYINNIEHYRPYYSKRGRDFVLAKRTWDAVKKPLLEALKSIANKQ